MSDCGCHADATKEEERRILRIALSLNATMFVVGVIAGADGGVDGTDRRRT